MKSVLCLCMCDVSFRHGTNTPQCNHHTWRICHLYHVEETLEWLQCRLRNQKWSEWRTWPWSAAVHQSAKCEAYFLCFLSTDFSLSSSLQMHHIVCILIWNRMWLLDITESVLYDGGNIWDNSLKGIIMNAQAFGGGEESLFVLSKLFLSTRISRDLTTMVYY